MSEALSESRSSGEQKAPELGAVIRYYADVFWRRRKLIAWTMGTFLALGILILLLFWRKYEVTAQVLIMKEGDCPMTVAVTDPTPVIEPTDDYIPTHAQIISSRLVVGRAIETIGVENLPTLLELKEKEARPAGRGNRSAAG